MSLHKRDIHYVMLEIVHKNAIYFVSSVFSLLTRRSRRKSWKQQDNTMFVPEMLGKSFNESFKTYGWNSSAETTRNFNKYLWFFSSSISMHFSLFRNFVISIAIFHWKPNLSKKGEKLFRKPLIIKFHI